MADYTNSGRTWVNERKKEGDNKPSFTGKGNFNGVKFEIGLWENEDGTHYMKFSEPYVKPENGAWKQAGERFKKDTLPTDQELDEPINMADIPF